MQTAKAGEVRQIPGQEPLSGADTDGPDGVGIGAQADIAYLGPTGDSMRADIVTLAEQIESALALLRRRL
jgi:hypothetical protein